MIKWLGEGIIRRDEVENIYPDLFEYTNTPSYQLPKEKGWVNQYFSEYVKSKIANQATSGLEDFISKHLQNGMTDSRQPKPFYSIELTSMYIIGLMVLGLTGYLSSSM